MSSEQDDTKCQRSHDAGWGNMNNCDILQGYAQGCRISPPLIKVFIGDMTIPVEAAKQGVEVGDHMVSGSTFANDFVGLSETPEGLQRQNRRGSRMNH